jgi:hypothetical protein
MRFAGTGARLDEIGSLKGGVDGIKNFHERFRKQISEPRGVVFDLTPEGMIYSGSGQNSKSEYRNTKQIGISNYPMTKTKSHCNFCQGYGSEYSNFDHSI